MNAIDQGFLLGLNGFARRWPALDQAANTLAHTNVFKGYLFVAVLLWFWADAAPERRRRNREIILTTAVATLLAVAIGKLLEHTLPFRYRPVHDPALGFVPPFGGSELVLQGASAFPSDHAVFFAALATGTWFISRRVGLAAHLYGVLFIYLPRIYVGFHHPTDLLAGAALGIVVAALANRETMRRRLAEPLLRWADRHARLFAVIAFLGALQFATLFLEAENLYSEARLVFCLTRHRGIGGPDAVMERCTRPSLREAAVPATGDGQRPSGAATP